MEYIYVTFGEQRIVLIDDLACGNTNDTISVQRGTHTISLSGPPPIPPTQLVTVINTTYASPMQIEFK